MKIFITGVAGMLGSHLSELLIKENHAIIGVDNLDVGKLQNLKKIKNNKKFKFIKTNLNNKKIIESQIKKSDIVVHLAAIKKVSELQSSFKTLDVNVNTTRLV